MSGYRLFSPDGRDREGVERAVAQIRSTDHPVEVKCFSRDEAFWFRDELEARGLPAGRFLMSWLEFKGAA